MNSDLIYDVGMHRGEDTAFYLRKGFRVVAVEARSDFCEECARQYATEVASGQLVIVNKAISDSAGTVRFFVNERSEWGTINPVWAERNRVRGARSRPITVEATTIREIVRDHGTPHYMKIDIEGADTLCLKGLLGVSDRPRFVSVESSATSIRDTFEQLGLLARLGYTRFKIVPQHRIEEQRCPDPPLEGRYVDERFEPGSSGLFGEEVPGEWESLARIRARYARIHLECAAVGPHSRVVRGIPRRIRRRLRSRVFPNWNGWYDTHATF